MENQINITFLHEEVYYCLTEIYFILYQKSDSFMYAITEITDYLTSSSTKFDNILNKYTNITKELITQNIFANFLSTSNYRRKNNIPLCPIRKGLLEIVEEDNEEENYDYCIKVNKFELLIMLVDTFNFIFHPTELHDYLVVDALKDTKLLDKIHRIYPLAKIEHSLKINKEFTDKEYLLFSLIEIIINNFERQTFLNGETPIPDRHYGTSILELYQKHDGSDLNIPNLYNRTMEEFNQNIINKKEPEYSKCLMVEMYLNIQIEKYRYSKPVSEMEKQLNDKMKKVNISQESLSEFYNTNQNEIIKTFVNSWHMFPQAYIIEDNVAFNLIRKKTQ